MADTTYLKKELEEFVRRKLALKYWMPFEKKFLKLRTGGRHEFDAVSENERIVVSIKSSGGEKSSPGKISIFHFPKRYNEELVIYKRKQVMKF